ncbi:unnamed protein product [Polarella glacialis]|uniref:Uncharacterized protein n=2 Tax=Polarella glacialis TaxID=89957 RepID=A0A813G7J2_POLGL|nr:unnamed protein product [Polarella glacialis]
MQKQTIQKDHANASLFDSDPAVQRYVHALKRIVTHMQGVQPSADPSKQGHVPAPIPDPSETGVPMMRDIRASDGTCREPEGVCPDEAYQVSRDRGLAFGSESGKAHPFAGIGNARGV